MTAARRLYQRELVLGLDYGQFYLFTAAEVDPVLVPGVVDQAVHGDGIAQAVGVLVVTSPHQNNFAMPLAVEVWDAEPPEDVAYWQEAFEAHLDVSSAGLIYESPTVDVAVIDVPPGSYRALITGRGFVGHGWPGSPEPSDKWRIRLWPSEGPTHPRRLLAFTDPATGVTAGDADVLELTGYDAGGADQRRERAHRAGVRIKADLDRAESARPMSGPLGETVIDTVVPGKVERYWFVAANLDVTRMYSRGEPAIGEWFGMLSLGPDSGDEDEDPITGTHGEIRCEWTELDDPNSVAMTWQWLGPVSARGAYEIVQPDGQPPRRVPRLDRPTTLTFALTDATRQPDLPATRVRLTHSDVPVEWISDLADFWNAKIDMWVGQAALPDTYWRNR